MKLFCAVIIFMAGSSCCNGVILRELPPTNYAPPTIYEGCESFCPSIDDPVCSIRAGPNGYICHFFPCYSALDGHNCDLNAAGNVSAIMSYTSDMALCSGVLSREEPCNANISPACERFCGADDPMVCSMRFDSGTIMCKKFLCRNALDAYNCNQNGNRSALMNYFRNTAICHNLTLEQEGPCNLTSALSTCRSSCSLNDSIVCSMRMENGNKICRKFLCRDALQAYNCNLHVNDPTYMTESEDTSICHNESFDEGPCIDPIVLPNCTSTCYARDPFVCAFRLGLIRGRLTATCQKFLCRYALEAHNCYFTRFYERHMWGVQNGSTSYCNHLIVDDEGTCRNFPYHEYMRE